MPSTTGARILTLDAAQTLVRTSFDPGVFAIDSAAACGIALGTTESDLFNGMMARNWREYRTINETRDPERGDEFWREMVRKWLVQIQHDPARMEEILTAGRDLLYGPNSPYFSLFDDTIPALDRLDALGVRMVVVSNWDYSLERVLKALNIYHRFELVLASLVEGVEKPEPGLFQVALDHLGVHAGQVVHVGDNPIDDVEGALGVGMRPLLIDRHRQTSDATCVHSLLAIPEALGWN